MKSSQIKNVTYVSGDEYDDEAGDTISFENDVDNGDKDSTKNKLNLYKEGSIHSSRVYNIVKKRSPDQLGDQFKVYGGRIQLNLDEYQK
jgi:hypothetical protein